MRLSRYRQNATHLLVAILALGVWALVVENALPAFFGEANAATSAGRSATFDTLNVHRININDADGTTRLVIANKDNFPAAKIRGKTYKRSIHSTAGIVFYEANGDETGGLVLTTHHNRDQASLILDYAYQPTDGISMGRLESRDGKEWRTGFAISDRRPYHPGEIKSSQGVQRISLADQSHDAELVIADAKGHPRIRIGVDKEGNPHIQMLDAAGHVRYNALKGNKQLR